MISRAESTDAFIVTDFGSTRILQSVGLLALNVEHGFIGLPCDFSERAGVPDRARYCQDLRLQELNLLNQVHGAVIVEPGAVGDSGLPEGDAWLLKRSSAVSTRRAFGIRTADCMPLILASREFVALVHIGWKGLGLNIAGNVARFFRERCSEVIIAIAGPCAGAADYEVGSELRSFLAGRGVFNEVDGRIFLDIRSSVAAQICAEGVPPDRISMSPISTISSTRWHSFRRDGEASGRNLAFCIL